MCVFGSDDERAEFLAILADVAQKAGTRILAYCLMSTHFHLLMHLTQVPLEVIMRRLLNRYARRFNIRREREGHLFQARYLSKLVQTDEYYRTVLPCIHNNPVKAGLVQDPADWPWSSHRQYVGSIRSTLVDVEGALSRLGETRDEALRRYHALMGTPLDASEIGFDDRLLELETVPAEVRIELEEIARAILDLQGVDVSGQSGLRRTRLLALARKEFAHRALSSGYRVGEIARFLGVSAGAVSHAVTTQLP